jgi:hypothetical protein
VTRSVNENPALPRLLLLLCALLLIWEPLSVGFTASRMLGAISLRGLPLALIVLLRLAVTAVGIAAGLALLGRRPGAITLAKVSLAASAATSLFVYMSPIVPNNRPPGDNTILAVLSISYYAAWIFYLQRSKNL